LKTAGYATAKGGMYMRFEEPDSCPMMLPGHGRERLAKTAARAVEIKQRPKEI